MAACLVDLIWRHGLPSRIIHDRAAEFLSEVIQETAHLMGMTQLPTSGGHPRTNGLVERFNRTLKQMLSKLVNKNGRNWDKMLGGVLFAYRSTPHQSTGMSPFYLLYGRDPKLPSALNFQAPVCKCDSHRHFYRVLQNPSLYTQRVLPRECLPEVAYP